MVARRGFEDLRGMLRGLPRKTVALVNPAGEEHLRAALLCRDQDLARVVLIGPRRELEAGLEALGVGTRGLDFEDVAEPSACASAGVALCREGKADVLLKGKIQTGTLLRAVLDRQHGLRDEGLLSDVLIYRDPDRGGRMIGLTDGGLNVAPELSAKRTIVSNAVEVAHSLGIDCPKVALLCALEAVSEAMPYTVEAHALAEEFRVSGRTDLVVEGPISLDCALDAEAASEKSFVSPVAGQADLLVFPNIEAANIAAKILLHYHAMDFGHVIAGARVPILIPSRGDPAEVRINSILLALVLEAYHDR